MDSSNDAPISPRRDGGITISALRTFVAIAESGSFSKTAAAFGVSQPTVSVQLNNLEQACGMPLFHRRPRIALTEAGRELFLRARLILSRFDEFEAVLHDFGALRRGSLSIGFSIATYAMPLIASFMRQHPATAVTTRVGNSGDLLEALAQCRLDIGIMGLLAPVEGMHCTLIGPQRLVACVASTDEWAAWDAVPLEALVTRDMVMREAGSMTRKLTEAAFAPQALKPVVRLEVGSREAVKEAVVAGLGIAVLLSGDAAGDARLKELPIAGTDVSGGIYAVSLRDAVDIPIVRAFLDHAVDRGASPIEGS